MTNLDHEKSAILAENQTSNEGGGFLQKLGGIVDNVPARIVAATIAVTAVTGGGDFAKSANAADDVQLAYSGAYAPEQATPLRHEFPETVLERAKINPGGPGYPRLLKFLQDHPTIISVNLVQQDVVELAKKIHFSVTDAAGENFHVSFPVLVTGTGRLDYKKLTDRLCNEMEAELAGTIVNGEVPKNDRITLNGRKNNSDLLLKLQYAFAEFPEVRDVEAMVQHVGFVKKLTLIAYDEHGRVLASVTALVPAKAGVRAMEEVAADKISDLVEQVKKGS